MICCHQICQVYFCHLIFHFINWLYTRNTRHSLLTYFEGVSSWEIKCCLSFAGIFWQLESDWDRVKPVQECLKGEREQENDRDTVSQFISSASFPQWPHYVLGKESLLCLPVLWLWWGAAVHTGATQGSESMSSSLQWHANSKNQPIAYR